ncbi:unnamed protein product [Didymodactylos carnosus]|uniref:Uncharacterized protein n=1 Tax=Didymodactylos carnosus TaxID=1234261 RepID=A0A814IQW4_9BILA|nr:unnamed protein product [Didymodactylos carnosus]CAF3797835.1 unnamed protein product [Didymodactylos carnosus]
MKMWMFSGSVVELPAKLRYRGYSMILMSIWVGYTEPQPHLWLKTIINELDHIKKQDTIIKKIDYRLKIYGITGDCPALKLILNFTGHGRYYCCWFCYLKGEHIGGKRQYRHEQEVTMNQEQEVTMNGPYDQSSTSASGCNQMDKIHSLLCACDQLNSCCVIYRRFIIHDQMFHSLNYHKRQNSVSYFVQYLFANDVEDRRFGSIELFFTCNNLDYAIIKHYRIKRLYSDYLAQSRYYRLLKKPLDSLFFILEKDHCQIDVVKTDFILNHCIITSVYCYTFTMANKSTQQSSKGRSIKPKPTYSPSDPITSTKQYLINYDDTRSYSIAGNSGIKRITNDGKVVLNNGRTAKLIMSGTKDECEEEWMSQTQSPQDDADADQDDDNIDRSSQQMLQMPSNTSRTPAPFRRRITLTNNRPGSLTRSLISVSSRRSTDQNRSTFTMTRNDRVNGPAGSLNPTRTNIGSDEGEDMDTSDNVPLSRLFQEL